MKHLIAWIWTAGILATVCLPETVVQAQTADGGTTRAWLALERLKQLAGEWEGTVDEKGSGPKATVNYKTTSNGSAVVETQFPGTKHEMVTVYHLDGRKLVLTHYCAMGNQPRMALTDESPTDELLFDFIGGSNVDPGRDVHMHSMRMKFVGRDEITCEWRIYREGKPGEAAKFFLKRKT